MWRRLASRTRLPPGPPGRFLTGHLHELRADGPGFFVRLMHDHGDVAHIRLATLDAYLLSHPDHVRTVMQDNVRAFSKVSRGYLKLKRLLGDGLLTSEGPRWLRQRRIAQPAFHREKLAHFGSVMTTAADALVARWKPFVSGELPVDISEEMMRVTLQVAGQAFMSADVSELMDTVKKALSYVTADTMRRINAVVDVPLSIPTPGNQRYRQAVDALDEIIYTLIRKRRSGQSQGYDLLAMLMEARDEDTGEWMNDRQLRDELMTLFLAGHETTANALTWVWYCLSQTPEVDRRLHAEVDLLRGRALKFDDMSKLKYVKMVAQEAMRLYPPAWILARSAVCDTEIGGFRIPKGSVAFVSPYATHRHPGFWPDPEIFDPDRFEPARLEEQHRFAYLPFGAGPRMCIGNSFAMAELVLVIATIARKYKLSLVPGHPVSPLPLVTLRMRYGLKMTIEERVP